MPTISDSRATYAQSLAFVPTRDELPIILNARALFGCGVEVGVQRGHFSAQLLDAWRGKHLISVDPWMEDPTGEYVDIANVGQSQQNALFEETQQRLARFGARSSVWRLTSVEAASQIPHHSLDFVYLDARHDYASVIEDLEAWFDKVRPGGILAGHDYLDGEFAAGVFGVKSAVDEFFLARGIAVRSTMHDVPWLTWMVEIPAPGHEEQAHQPSDVALPRMTLAARTAVTLSFQAQGRALQVKLALDPSQMSQKIMLDSFANNTVYEPETCALLTSVLRDGDVFVDVGTHVGFFTSLAATLVGERGRVVSFEPEERNFGQLGDHLTINGFQNVMPICAAVGDRETTAELWVNADNDGGHALWEVGRHAYNARSRALMHRRAVPVTTLDHHFGDASAAIPKLIKIDAEGSELRVLRGARALLERRVPYVVAEINDFALEQMGDSQDALRNYMTELGYETNCIHPASGELITLQPDQRVVSEQVYNLVFRHHSAPLIGAAA